MLTKVSPTCWTVLGILLTAILAPAGVRQYDAADRERPPAESGPAASSAAPPQDRRPSITRVRATGTGPTPEAAFQVAMDAALRQAVAAEVSAADWHQHGRDYLASLRRDGTGVLRGWHELSSSSERHLTGRVYRCEVAVEVDAGALRERLNPARPVARR